MGEVYRATDTKLGRDIALKVLPAEMAQDPERLARFRREAKALAQLDHPNIVTIHSVEECDGVHFLTMQLVEGQPLDRLIPAGGLPVERIVEIAGALGDALAAAHEKGIVHRDLKPANVMVSNEGRVKVLDFGLAKDVGASDPADATLTSDHRTQAGVVMGTPAYMSPEQTSGRPLDHRTDIFSLGVVLHEMATGRRPFDGNSSAELVSAILRDTAPPVTDVRHDLPSDLARIIRRCLEKDPRHRVQTARDVSNEFRDLARQISQQLIPPKISTTRTVAAADSSGARSDEGFWIAVLPFKYSGGNADLTALTEGLTEDIVTGLSRFPYLRVIARSSTLRYANESADVRAAGKDLGARYVMEGSLRQAGTKLRLAVQLVDAVDGAHLWAENFERAFSPEVVFELQDDLVPRIVSTVADMHGILPHSMSEAVRSRDPGQLSPYEAVLRSFGYFERVTPEDLAAARPALDLAVQKAPAYADAWAMLALLHVQDYAQGFDLEADSLTRGTAAARRAVAAAPSNHLAHFSLAQALFFQKEFPSFRNAAARAVELNPMDGNSLAALGEFLTYAGDAERGLALAERAKQLNPNHPGWYWHANFNHAYRQGDYRGALNFALKSNMTDNWGRHALMAAAYGQLGEREEASKALRDLLRLRPGIGGTIQREAKKWFDPEYGEHLLEGLRKAGLEIGGKSGTSVAVKASDSGAARADEGFWVAVLPFKYSGGNAELTALAEGLTDDIVTGLSRFSYLRVIARSSTSRLANQAVDIRSAGKELGARYVMEGSLRQAGTKLRLTVQLVDAVSGAHLWAENYERSFNPESVFEIQDDLVPCIVSTVADAYGVLPYSMSDVVRSKPLDQLSPYEALLRAIGCGYRLTPEEYAVARTCLERAVQQVPGYADGWAMLSMLYADEYGLEFNAQPDPLGRALQAARRATDAAPSSSLAQSALAKTLFFRKEFQAFRSAAEQAISLNPMDGAKLAQLGSVLAYSGDWERGCALVERAMQLNPRHPGWYWFPLAWNAYRKGDYRGALNLTLKINLPGFFPTYEVLAAAYGQLGERDAASEALSEMLRLVPSFGKVARVLKSKWFDPEMVEHVLDGLRKAGLEIPDDPAKPSASPATSNSGAVRADEGFWIAVLPFKYAGTSAELKALADGLSEEIVTGLSRFSYLRVIARSSTARYAGEALDVRSAGKELGARYVMEGSLRQAGTKLRLAIQLVDAGSGAHLWAENYERSFSPENIFALQDDVVPRIVSTVADQHGVLPHSMSNLIRKKSDEQLSPYEAVLRVFGLHERMSQEEHASVRTLLEHTVQRAPGEGDCWAMLATLYCDEYMFGFKGEPDPLGRSQTAARRAIEIEPSNWLASQAVAQSLFFRKEWQAFRPVAERTIALNRMDGAAWAFMGLLLALSGEWERGCEVAAAARQLNPHHPGWYWLPSVFDAYRKQEYRASVDAALRINMPGYFWGPATSAAAFGQLGERERAQKAVKELLAIRPDFATTAREEFGKWFDDELVEHYVEGLRKAGLEVGGTAGNSFAAKASDSGAVRAEEGFWVAVLPFKYSGGNADLTALADGLSEDVVTGLSRFSYLRVIARGSTLHYANQATDLRTVGKELGARYVMEGSLRQAGAKLRLAVQLVDTVSGAHLWAESYERTFSPEAVFALQDDLVPRIVSTAADMHGVLPRSMSEVVRSKASDQLSPYEAFLRSIDFNYRVTPEEHAAARTCMERAVQQAPGYADGWAMLSGLYAEEYGMEYNVLPDSVGRAVQAAQRAVDAAPLNALAHQALARALFFRKEFQAFRTAAELAVELNPMSASTLCAMGTLIAYVGDWEHGCALVERAMQLLPRHPGWYLFPLFHKAYRNGDYHGAVSVGLKFNIPGFFATHLFMAAAYAQLGERHAAGKELRDLLRVRPGIAVWAREGLRRYHDRELVEHYIEGLRKAGLEITGEQSSAPTKPATQTEQ